MLIVNMRSKTILLTWVLLASHSLSYAQDYGLQRDIPIDIKAASSDFNYAKNKLSFSRLRIKQGSMEIEADYAETDKLDFDDGLWVFRGNVRIETALSLMTCDSARLTFKKRQLYNADINGKPARFEQPDPKSDKTNQGEANIMNYNVTEGTIALSDNAIFKDGANQMSGSSITYDVVSRSIRANAGEGSSVRIMIEANPSATTQYNTD